MKESALHSVDVAQVGAEQVDRPVVVFGYCRTRYGRRGRTDLAPDVVTFNQTSVGSMGWHPYLVLTVFLMLHHRSVIHF